MLLHRTLPPIIVVAGLGNYCSCWVHYTLLQDTICVLLPCVNPHTGHVAVQFATQLALEVARHAYSFYCVPSCVQVLRLHVLPHASLRVVQLVTIIALEDKDTPIFLVFQPHVLPHTELGLVNPVTLFAVYI